ncbi:bifunctional diaminohydroxyphosphoribosylaminopyrimidine deaminase/5-amino-6-(5-phosphoribosylamino)uracil reductase RibD [Parachlamydia sp. AcF125]|uniref:bifunctional diaminohydroxyphosphoribosylaminopyrimidine deaminase/5-amino-6-(5-phosphoribosylamino)uracil reductase RibD n=1 Tax=Parachlamydia sp. AcF125 TaxID=2795736 RepID=UPI001BD847A9|nr:bifunctional diaminohydroxyphosphoribosylaminopyrimidine deaminase/5-amino-6-(5-phosphoribosylamino)uracil reductase RibD [Parachlamydia sp. AcF125]MBS4168409.1 Riboflavin biosynthesis protein RibD [Parachlamydia sp. AcF125]
MSVEVAFMDRALALAMQARFLSPPNPWVGAVIVNAGKIVGEGFTQIPGSAHAEIIALQQARKLAENSTLYVTLEPCAHFGRTPPCIKAIIQAKVAHVVIALEDPDPQVQGKGIQQLKEAGILVSVGIRQQKAAELLEPYLFQRKTGRPFCIAKAAISLDGRIAASDYSSKWITNELAREDAQKLRAESQAILIGCGTAKHDRPHLTVRAFSPPPHTPPLRVVLDSRGSLTDPSSPLFNIHLAPTWILTTSDCPQKVRELWHEHGVKSFVLSKAKNGEGVDLNEAMETLGSRGILQVLIEGGATVLGQFMREQLIQALHLYVGPKILGYDGIPLFGSYSPKTLINAPQFQLKETKRLGDCVYLHYRR